MRSFLGHEISWTGTKREEILRIALGVLGVRDVSDYYDIDDILSCENVLS